MRRLSGIAAAAALALIFADAPAQEPEAGQLLFASASVDDPDFERTVLLIVHHDEDGTIALALNRPTWVTPGQAFPEVESLTGYRGEVFLGGPNTPNQPLLLFDSRAGQQPNARRVIGSIYVTTDMTMVARLQPDSLADDLAGPPRLRLFAGHAVWIPGQLQQEIDRGIWELGLAQSEFVFTTDPEGLWERRPAGAQVTAALR